MTGRLLARRATLSAKGGMMLNRAHPGVRLVALMATLALLAGCGRFVPSPKPGVSLLPDPSQSQGAPSGCFLTQAEVEAAAGKTLTMPPDGSTGPKGDQSCQYYFGGAPPGGSGCNCLQTNGPFDLQGQGTAWLDDLPSGGETVVGVGDEAYMFNASTGNDFWAVKGQTGIHIYISFQFLTVEQYSTLANAMFARIDAGA
jgi:hypothetical protein